MNEFSCRVGRRLVGGLGKTVRLVVMDKTHRANAKARRRVASRRTPFLPRSFIFDNVATDAVVASKDDLLEFSTIYARHDHNMIIVFCVFSKRSFKTLKWTVGVQHYHA